MAIRTDEIYNITGFSYGYPGGRFGLREIDLRICAGERVALTGANGAGKTTLLRALSGLLPVSDGSILYRGERIPEVGFDFAGKGVVVMFQDPDDQLFCNTIMEDMLFAPFSRGEKGAEIVEYARQWLGRVELDDKADKAPNCLSIGQRKRAIFAALMALKPDLLILDEPTANLDEHGKEIIITLLKEFDGTLIVVSHDSLVVSALCSRQITLTAGMITEDDSASNKMRPGSSTEESQRQPVATPLKLQASQTVLVELKDYSVIYPDGTRALSDVNLAVLDGESVALIGENGAGKSTIAKCLMGLVCGSGDYYYNGRAISAKKRGDLRRYIGLLFQDTADQLFCASCLDEVAFGLRKQGFSKQEAEGRAHDLLAKVGLAGYEAQVPLHLSGGERRRLALAAVLSLSPDVLILDEPTANLDEYSCQLLANVINQLEITKIIISHNRRLLEECCSRGIVLAHGRNVGEVEFC